MSEDIINVIPMRAGASRPPGYSRPTPRNTHPSSSRSSSISYRIDGHAGPQVLCSLCDLDVRWTTYNQEETRQLHFNYGGCHEAQGISDHRWLGFRGILRSQPSAGGPAKHTRQWQQGVPRMSGGQTGRKVPGGQDSQWNRRSRATDQDKDVLGHSMAGPHEQPDPAGVLGMSRHSGRSSLPGRENG